MYTPGFPKNVFFEKKRKIEAPQGVILTQHGSVCSRHRASFHNEMVVPVGSLMDPGKAAPPAQQGEPGVARHCPLRSGAIVGPVADFCLTGGERGEKLLVF